MGKQLRKFNRATHRDLGYFFVAMILIYSISGIAINHLDDWNPNYYVKAWQEEVSPSTLSNSMDRKTIKQLLIDCDIDNPYRKHYFPDAQNCKVFVKNGDVLIDLQSGKIQIEIVERRPFLHVFNWLHYNPNTIWKWFSDVFAVGLILLAISGMFILKGKTGLKWRGTILISLGVLVPVIFLMLFYF
jgi:hypothetical protein